MRLSLILILFSLVFSACKEDDNPLTGHSGNPPGESDSAIIVDQTGKRWDVTHAVEVYGFAKENFNYGLGLDAIKPIDFPRSIREGNSEYPRPHSEQPVIGLIINDDIRAYPVNILSSREIVNDLIGGSDVAVAY